MSLSGQNLSIVIVTLKSEKIIHECIKSINQDLPIIVVENSYNETFKNDLESKYKNLKCILSKSNLGMGAANNIGIKSSSTDYVLILNPDVILQNNTLDEIFLARFIDNFVLPLAVGPAIIIVGIGLLIIFNFSKIYYYNASN